MSLIMVNTVTLRLDHGQEFEELVGELAKKARDKREKWRWTAHAVLFGESRNLHFVHESEDYAALEKLGTVRDLWLRVLGDKRGMEAFQQANACIEDVQHTISIDRPELSYPPDTEDRTAAPYAVVTLANPRPGHAEAVEELIRKMAEAIPKIGDPARMTAYQVLFGDLGRLWTVRPLTKLADLDRQRPTPDLLTQAFGASEGGLIWRAGMEAMQSARREIVAYRDELSHPPRA
jgi:hypothetical protein